MATYYMESTIYEIAQGIEALIARGVITHKKRIFLYGVDKYSFAMKTLLTNHGFRLDGYLSDDMEQITAYKRQVKSAFRYFNATKDMIDVYPIEEKLNFFDDSLIILIASPNSPISKIVDLGYRKNTHIFQVFDWDQDRFAETVGNKRRMSIREIQNVAKEILCNVDIFCHEHGIRYWVCGGTLLGTIRHQGFIPWDDDVDIFMPWDDYKRFTAGFSDKGMYQIISPESVDRRDFFGLFSKIFDDKTMVVEKNPLTRFVHPVAIDVFPLIGMPEKEAERNAFFRHFTELTRQITEDLYAHNGDYSVYNKWYPAQEQFLEKYDFDRSNFAGVLGTRYEERDCTSASVYSTTLRMPFEDMEVNVPAGYREYLDNLYGKDWEQLPPEENRKSHHGMEAYWL